MKSKEKYEINLKLINYFYKFFKTYFSLLYKD